MHLEDLGPDIIIVIVTYNGIFWIQECLESCTPYPIIVVDNASTDGTTDFIRKNFPDVHLLVQNENLGFGQANNIGISHALKLGAEHVFLLNQDAYLQIGSLNELINVQKQFPGYGILSPIHLDGKGTEFDDSFKNYLNKNVDFLNDPKVLNEQNGSPVLEVPFINAAGWLLSKNVLNTVGGFDPIFFHYGEDDNFCQRVRFHGFKVGVVKNTFLRHDRETRAKPIIVWKSPEFFSRMEKELKVKYADINEDKIDGLYELRRKNRGKYLRLILKLQFRKAKEYYKENLLFKRVIPEIKKSRRINKEKKSHYLLIE